MAKKPDLAASLAEVSGSTRRKPEPVAPSQEPSEKDTVPITVRFPIQVRNQLKIMAIEQKTTVNNLAAEAFNDLFAKHSKPEICLFEKKKAAKR
jgi:predicted HicB family RNase H-like nuclease